MLSSQYFYFKPVPKAPSSLERASGAHSKHREGSGEPPVAQVRLVGQTTGHIFLMTFPHDCDRDHDWLIITGSILLQCAPRSPQGCSLAWKWLVWWLYGCIADRGHGNNLGMCKVEKKISKISDNIFFFFLPGGS